MTDFGDGQLDVIDPVRGTVDEPEPPGRVAYPSVIQTATAYVAKEVVNLVQGHSRERLPQERHVEARAVEGDEEFRALHGRGKILEVGTLDERSSSGTVVHADNGHGISTE